jgi:predicted GNAT superfamily acetyltransferase
MSRRLTSFDPASQAAAAADEAARRAGVRIGRLDDIDAIHEASRLFNRVWVTPETQPLISASTLRALSHSGNYVYAAYDGSEMVGAIVGFIGYDHGSLQLHSHMTGVSAKLQGKSVGFALKQHQRAWALERGMNHVTWTFDPLVRRNAYFNLTKLGASVTAYYTSFYGQMNDGINDKDETDRVLIEWHLESPQATEASVRQLSAPDLGNPERLDSRIALAVGSDGAPIEQHRSADTLLVCVPEDIVELRHRDEELAHQWRLALRNVLGSALNDGYDAVGMTRSGFYILQRKT